MQHFVNITNKVDKTKIRKEKNAKGDTVWIVPSYTLPDDVVMNGIFYSSDEIAKSYRTLEGTPAPVGHPYNDEGEYVSANSEDGLNYFYAGVTNKNVERVSDPVYGHRVYVEKHVNERVANQSELGRRVISALKSGEPIHTSTGIIMNMVPVQGVNAAGKEYQGMASGMVFDHDSILLDEEGAATPADGVGMLVNHKLLTQVHRDGATLTVNTVVNPELTCDTIPSNERGAFIASEIAKDKTLWESFVNVLKTCGAATFKTQEENPMFQKHIEKMLTEAKIDIVNMSDEQKLAAYEDHLKAKPEPQGETVVNQDIAELVANAVNDAIAKREADAEKATRAELAATLKTNGVELDEKDQASMTVNALRTLAEKSAPAKAAYGYGAGMVANSEDGLDEMKMPSVELN